MSSAAHVAEKDGEEYRSIVLPLAFLTLSVYFLFSVFSVEPFIQNEVVGQAHYWTNSPYAFWEVLLDPNLNGDKPGRFRFLEYLAEGGYWKLMHAGLLPKTLYDLASLTLVLATGGLLYAYAKKRGLGAWAALLCLGFFLLGCPNFMVVVFHYRKAKILASFLLALLLTSETLFSLRSRWLYGVLGFLGVFVDPTFILFAPLVTLANDVSRNELTRTVRLLAGFGLAVPTIWVFNAVIAPRFTAQADFTLWVSDRPKRYLNVANWLFAPEIFPDWISPGHGAGFWLHGGEILLCLGAIGFTTWLVRSQRWREYFIAAAIPAIILIGAFLVRPSRSNAEFAAYYGHTAFTLFSFSLVEGGLLLRPVPIVAFRRAAVVLLLLSIGFHQAFRTELLNRWKDFHVIDKERFAKDYSDFRAIKVALVSKKPFTLTLEGVDKQSNTRMAFDAQFKPLGRGYHRTTFGYFLIPVLFHRELSTGQLQLVTDKS